MSKTQASTGLVYKKNNIKNLELGLNSMSQSY